MSRYGKWILLCFCVAWCFFIWHFSLAGAGESSASSGRVLEIANETLQVLHIPARFTHHMIRKLAHFTEFFVLGALAAATTHAFSWRRAWLIALPVPIAVAGIDETLQRFSAGRNASFLDVLLDSAGGICGILAFSLVFLLVFWLVVRKKEEKISKTT